MTLADFLLARIAEDEGWAGGIHEEDCDPPGCTCGDPARVLAECEAKRRIVELHDRGHECSQYDHHGEVDSCTYAHDFDDCSTLRLLALPYASHPDYQTEWKPT
jgi:hypothetical protein